MKKTNARIEKWRNMLEGGLFCDPNLVKSRVRKGIPSGMRSLAWPQIVGLKNFIKQKEKHYSFEKLLKQRSASVQEIALDIPRTFPEEEESKVLGKSINNVLKAVSIIFPEVGYCQGMNFLVQRVLLVLDDEDTFWLMHYLVEKDPYLKQNYSDPKSIEKQNYVLSELMLKKTPSIAKTFEAQGITPPLYSVKWFMTLYSPLISEEFFYRIFDVYLNQGWSIIYAVAINFLKNNEPKILKNSFENNMYLLNSEIYSVNNIDDFMHKAYELEITPSIIFPLEKQFELQQDNTKKIPQRVHKENNTYKEPLNENMTGLRFQSMPIELKFEGFQNLKSIRQQKVILD